MGNANSNGTQPLAMMAVARKLRLQRFQIIIMRESLKSFSDSYGFVDRASFDQSLTRAKITQNQALEIFALLFTMWDHHDVNVVPAKKFAVGIAPLACSCDDLASVLRFSLHINDENNIGKVSPKELHDVLISIDNTASYFGDIQLEPGDIDSVVEAVFDGENGVIAREFCVRKLQSNAYIKRFVSGKTRPRVQFKLDIEFPTETPKPMPPLGLTLNEEPYLAVTTPQSPLIENRESVLTFDDENSENRPIYSPIRAKRSSSGLDESWASFITEDTTKSKDPPSLVFILQPLQDNLTSPFARGTRDPPSFRR